MDPVMAALALVVFVYVGYAAMVYWWSRIEAYTGEPHGVAPGVAIALGAFMVGISALRLVVPYPYPSGDLRGEPLFAILFGAIFIVGGVLLVAFGLRHRSERH
jgi:hypothetical protein